MRVFSFFHHNLANNINKTRILRGEGRTRAYSYRQDSLMAKYILQEGQVC